MKYLHIDHEKSTEKSLFTQNSGRHGPNYFNTQP